MTSNHSEFSQRDKNAPDEKVTVYNKSLDAEVILSELNQDKVLELLPIVIIVSCLMVFGLIGNTSVLLFFRRKARKDTPSFFYHDFSCGGLDSMFGYISNNNGTCNNIFI